MDTLKEVIKFITNLRGLWNTVKASVMSMRAPSPVGVADVIERNIAPEWADTLRKDEKWNSIRASRSFDEAKQKALSYAKGIPIFQDQSEKEIEDYTMNMGRSLNFID